MAAQPGPNLCCFQHKIQMPWLTTQGPMLPALNLDFHAQFLSLSYWTEAFWGPDSTGGCLGRCGDHDLFAEGIKE